MTENLAPVAPAAPVSLETLRNGPVPKGASFGDIFNALESQGKLMTAAELGEGWTVLATQDKQRLVGQRLMIVDWNFNQGDNGIFASMKVVTAAGEFLIVNDGSTGICKQLQDLEATEETRAIYCAHGLRVSEYEYTAEDGSKRPAKTYYLDTSA